MRKLAAILLFTFALAGCNSAATPAPGDGPRDTAAPPSLSPSVPAPNSTEAKLPGGKVTYPDGVEIEVIKIDRDKVGEYDSTGSAKKGDEVLVFSIRVTNGSSEPLDAMMSVNARVGADGTAVEPWYGDGLTPATGTITPGKSGTFRYGFVIKTPNEVTLDAQPLLKDAAVFSGKIPAA